MWSVCKYLSGKSDKSDFTACWHEGGKSNGKWERKIAGKGKTTREGKQARAMGNVRPDRPVCPGLVRLVCPGAVGYSSVWSAVD